MVLMRRLLILRFFVEVIRMVLGLMCLWKIFWVCNGVIVLVILWVIYVVFSVDSGLVFSSFLIDLLGVYLLMIYEVGFFGLVMIVLRICKKCELVVIVVCLVVLRIVGV